MKIEVPNKEKSTVDIIDEYKRIIAEQNKVIDVLKKKITNLEEKIDYLIRQQFCTKSEKIEHNQPTLFDTPDTKIEVVEEEEIEIAFKRKKGGRRTPPKDLPRVRVEHDIDENEKQCSCGEKMFRIKEIVSEQYDIIPAKFQIIQNVRFLYGCRCGAKPKSTPLKPFILPKHQVTASFLAAVVVQKFEDALPLHRQAKIYKNRFGVPFNDTTLSNWIIKSAKVLTPFSDLLKERLLQNEYIQADETTLQVLKEKGKKASAKSYIWLGRGEDRYKVVYMHYANNRNAQTPADLFCGFNGYLQTDGYSGYNKLVSSANITQLGCWAHARRRFADILKSSVSDKESKALANEAVILIRKLYKIEKEIKDDPPDKKTHIRKEKSKYIIDTIEAWKDANFFKAQTMGGAIAKAFTYLNNQFEKLCVYVEDGRLHIDNNQAENHIRPVALGRKNWLFATSVEGAKAVALWYTLVETAKANGVEPYGYLKYLMTQFPLYKSEGRDMENLLPWNVTKEDLA